MTFLLPAQLILLYLTIFGKFSMNFQILDVAISLAKVADVDRNLGNEGAAVGGFQEAINLLESLTLSSEEVGLEQRVRLIVDC